MPFTTRIAVVFGDTDPAGLVYYPNIFHYCHIAMERFISERTGTNYSELIAKHRIGLPTVKVEAEFLHTILYGDEIDIEVDILSMGNSSITLTYSVKRASDQKLCARVEQVHVTMNLDSRRPLPATTLLPGF